jgi:predicted RNA-binding protein with PIN domain
MYEASRKGAVLDTVLATDDHLQRDMVSAMGVPTMSAQALRAEVERAEDDRSVEMRRRDGGPAAGGRTENRIENRVENRIENRIDPDVRRRLEEMRRGGDTGR